MEKLSSAIDALASFIRHWFLWFETQGEKYMDIADHDKINMNPITFFSSKPTGPRFYFVFVVYDHGGTLIYVWQ